jgi:hypothetical protein
MGRLGCPETSARNYHYTLRNIPGERRFNLYRYGSLKSRDSLYFGLDGPGFKFRQGKKDFLLSTTSKPALGLTQLSVKWVSGSFLGNKAIEV